MIVKLNLLPWRTDLKQHETTAFRKQLILIALTGVLILSVLHILINTAQTKQLITLQFLHKASIEHDKKLLDIQQLALRKQKLVNKINLLQKLQVSRIETAHLLAELPTLLPEGLYLTHLSQKNREISFSGKAQSNREVSLFMKAITDSVWLQSPKLIVIESKDKLLLNDFLLTATFQTPCAEFLDTLR